MSAAHVIQHAEHGNSGSFFIEQHGRRLGELTYSRRGASLVNIDHTEVDASLRGQGAARKLLDAAVHWARETHTQVTATCSYATAQFARDLSIQDVLSPDAPAAPAACEIRRPND